MAESDSRLPAGVAILPRKPEQMAFEEVPRNWFAHSRALSTAADLFSFIIPEHERFFIRTVRKYRSRAQDPEEEALVKAFIQQEAIHYTTHEAYNETRKAFGIDVDRDLSTIRKVFQALEKRYPLKVRLGMTAFMEHCTAIAAHQALRPDSTLRFAHPTMRGLWEWHALEEIEHKAVAYDLFKEAGGGYFLRAYSALIVIAADARLFRVLIRRARRAAKQNPHDESAGLSTEQNADRKQAIREERRNALRLFWAGVRYFIPGFHPWKDDDSHLLQAHYPTYGRGVAALPADAGLTAAQPG